ncbi:4-phosphoerythronate dehydrogenase [Colwellia chukchiensis]|uniref:Erythronate-4-phosphate dehydrogenase n=1 Tax=Colwellia chukchiensis TaxID=641665 RepID=A0A1H7GV44_9GAMM|nr:4-phosphoerythronate dehydrogenase [Colwellia chukchiensis]SEK40922.1 4-phosphoerythronate dehydrogenase [Colwellia chukchiensis]
MNIYYDENMPFAAEFFAELGTLTAFSGRCLQAQDISDADVLLVRSISQVNQALLKDNQRLRFVGTATIGVDHIDQAYLAARNIQFSSAPGCNAVSVAEYVLSALVVLAERYLFTLADLTVGIVGAGNTGSRLSEKLSALNIKHVLCDPILAQNPDDQRQYVTLEQALECDVVSLHVPLTRAGEHATYHLLDAERLAKLSDQQILINACRGEVIDNAALLKLKQQGQGVKLVLDVWEHEPDILMPLIDYCEISTAHIAGYSLEGKARGTEILYRALCKQLAILPNKQLKDFLPVPAISSVKINSPIDELLLNQLVKMVYDVRRDDAIFRQQINTQGFDYIRKTYPARREFSSLSVALNNSLNLAMPNQLGFNFNIQ